MMNILSLARPEVRGLVVYPGPDLGENSIRLHANEAARALDALALAGLNRYPDVRPAGLTRKMAELYGVTAENVLVTRGSSEGIDLLMRAFCVAGQDEVLLTPPAFEMYQVYASIQGAATVSVPLQADKDYSVDAEALLGACNERGKLIFLSSPNNPVGTVVPRQQIEKILRALEGKCVVVVDEAYVEFSESGSLVSLVAEHENLVVLRTLSKAYALAGVRCGAVVASPPLIGLLEGLLPPYALSSPVVSLAELALSSRNIACARKNIRETVAERERVRRMLATCSVIEKIWPSEANFLFVGLTDVDAVKKRLAEAGVIIRTYDDNSQLQGCARISIGTVDENNSFLDAIRSLG